jgi:hypothetical protein
MRIRTVILLGLALAIGALSAVVGIVVLGTVADTEGHHVVARSAPAVEDPALHERTLATRIGETLLGVEDQRAYYDAVLLARSAALPAQPSSAVAERRAQAEAILVGVAREDGEPRLRASAANLLGSLLFEDAKVARQNPRRFLEQSFGAFQDAALADPSSVAARRNLELLSTLPLLTIFRKETSPGTEASASGGGETGY